MIERRQGFQSALLSQPLVLLLFRIITNMSRLLKHTVKRDFKAAIWIDWGNENIYWDCHRTDSYQGWEFYVLRTRGFQSTMISLKSCVLIVLGVGKVQSTKLLNGRDFLFGGGRLIWSRKSNRVKSPLWCRRLNFLWYISCSSDQHLKRGRKTVQ